MILEATKILLIYFFNIFSFISPLQTLTHSEPLNPMFCVMTDLLVEHLNSALIMENCLSISYSWQQQYRP